MKSLDLLDLLTILLIVPKIIVKISGCTKGFKWCSQYANAFCIADF